MRQNFYIRLFETLETEGVRYLVVGGLAMVLYGAPRFTADVDLMVDLSPQNLTRLKNALEKLGLEPSAPMKFEQFENPDVRESWWRDRNMRALNFANPNAPAESVDILIKNPMDFDGAFERKTVFEINGVEVYVISRQDLLKLKQLSGREKDLADIETLRELYGEDEAF